MTLRPGGAKVASLPESSGVATESADLLAVAVSAESALVRSGVPARVPPAPASTNAGVSRSMRGNRRRNTSPELRLRSALHRRGWRFRVDLPVELGAGRRPRPDLLFTRARVAVFVDGCFWHCCPVHGRPPMSNKSYWEPKLIRNAQRDREDTFRLERAGWVVVRLWEHVNVEDAVASVEMALGAKRGRLRVG